MGLKRKLVKRINRYTIFYNQKDDGRHEFYVVKKGTKPQRFISEDYDEAKLDAWTYAKNNPHETKRSCYIYKGLSVSMYITAEEAEYLLSMIDHMPYYPDTKKKLKKAIDRSYKKWRDYHDKKR